jgi:hypothetical protein
MQLVFRVTHRRGSVAAVQRVDGRAGKNEKKGLTQRKQREQRLLAAFPRASLRGPWP